MPRTIPSHIYFDPYHESRVQITYSADHILLRLPRMGFWRTFPLYIVGGIFALAGVSFICAALLHEDWGAALFSSVFLAAGIGVLTYGQCQADQSASVELTPDNLIVTQFSRWREPERIEQPWDQLAAVKIGFSNTTSEPPPGLILTTVTGDRIPILQNRTIEELERFEQLLKSFIFSPGQPSG